MGYEISSQFYLQEGELPQDQLYNKSAYTELDKSSCQIYPTSFDVLTINYLPLDDGYETIKWHKASSNKKGRLWVLGGDSKLRIYVYDPMNIKLLETIPLDPNISNNKEGALSSNVEFFEMANTLYFFNGDSAYFMTLEPPFSLSALKGFETKGKEIVQAGIYHPTDRQIWVSTQETIFVYAANETGSLMLQHKVEISSEETV